MGCGASAKASPLSKYAPDGTHETPEVAHTAFPVTSTPPPPCIASAVEHPADGDPLPPYPVAGGYQQPLASTSASAAPPQSPLSAVEPAWDRGQPDPSAARRWPDGKKGLEARAEALTGMFQTYEADAAAAVATDPEKPLEPLVSPKNVQLLAQVLGADVAREPFIVPAAKILLSSLVAAFRESRSFGVPDVQHCLDVFGQHRSKHTDSFSAAAEQAAAFAGKVSCVECKLRATCYCADCEDTLCGRCFERLHAKGNRAKHARLDVNMAGFKQSQNGLDIETNPGQVFTRWHPFTDAGGMKFFYNFERQEAVRKIPEEELVWQPPPPLPALIS